MSLTYYLTIDGIDGGSTAAGHEGAFEISGYDFDVTLPAGVIGIGKADFSPLTVFLDLGLGSTALLRDVALGGHIPLVRLEGVTSGNDTVYDLRLADVQVAVYSDTNAGQDRLEFDYGRIGLSTRSQNADGSLNDPQSFAFNVATSEDAGMPPVPVAGSSPGIVPQPVKYYLTIDGIDGGSTAPGHEGAFEISSYDFHITLPPGGVIGGSGGGSGVAEFSPLTVLLDLGLGSTALLRDVARGGHIDSVRLEGVTSGNDTVYDLRLANVLVDGYSDTNAGHDQLVFEYAQIGLSTR